MAEIVFYEYESLYSDEIDAYSQDAVLDSFQDAGEAYQVQYLDYSLIFGILIGFCIVLKLIRFIKQSFSHTRS